MDNSIKNEFMLRILNSFSAPSHRLHILALGLRDFCIHFKGKESKVGLRNGEI